MKLTLAERFTLQGILPQQGNFLVVTKAAELAKVLMPTEQEIKDLEVKEDEGKISWNNAAYEAEIEIGEFIFETIKKTLETMDKQEKLEPRHISLYSKFINPA